MMSLWGLFKNPLLFKVESSLYIVIQALYTDFFFNLIGALSMKSIWIKSACAIAAMMCFSVQAQTAAPAPNTTGPSAAGTNNLLIASVAWKQTAAEYRALYYQGYNLAKFRVEQAIAKRKAGDKPLAVVTDLDDTVLLPLPYWGHLINQNKDFFKL